MTEKAPKMPGYIERRDDDALTLGELRRRGWRIFSAISEAYEVPGAPSPAPMPAPAALPSPAPIAAVSTRPAPTIAAAPARAAPAAPPPSVAEAAEARWRVSPEVRAEFRDNLPGYLAYCEAFAAGRIRIIRDRTFAYDSVGAR